MDEKERNKEELYAEGVYDIYDYYGVDKSGSDLEVASALWGAIGRSMLYEDGTL